MAKRNTGEKTQRYESSGFVRKLRKRFAEWIERPRFNVVWLTFEDMPGYPTTLHYADAASAKVIIDYEFEDPDDDLPATAIARNA